MKPLLDGRHRWVVVEREGARTTHACRVCGLSKTFESIISDQVLEALWEGINRPNPYRAMFR